MSTAATTRKGNKKTYRNRLIQLSSRTRRQLKDPRKETKRKETDEERHKDEYVEEELEEEAGKPRPRSQFSLPNYEIAKSGPLLAHTESAPGRLAAKAPAIEDFARKSPMTQYMGFEKAFFQNNAPQLLNAHVKIEDEDRILFQVSCGGLEQFQQYPNLSLGTERPIDCFAQALFSLGLIEAGCAKENAKRINLEGKDGVLFNISREYIRRIFGLGDGMISYNQKWLCEYNPANKKKGTNPDAKKYITDFLKKYLKPGNATIISLYFHKYGIFTNGHYMIAYRNNTEASPIYYFDPQQQDVRSHKETISRTLGHVIKYNGNKLLCHFGYYSLYELEEPIIPLNDRCPIPFIPKSTEKVEKAAKKEE